MIRRKSVCLAGVCLMLAGPARAGTCHLMSYGTLQVAMMGERATALAKINGAATRFILDTGASFNTLSRAQAQSLGLRLRQAPFGFVLRGVGGDAYTHLTQVRDFGILDSTIHHVEFIVGGTDSGRGLLGANLLDFADLEIDLANGKMKFFKPDHCDDSALAYWTKGRSAEVANIERADRNGDRRTFPEVTINGKEMRAAIDSGAAATVLSRDAAERIGLHLDPKNVKVGRGFGIGSKTLKTWTVTIDSFSIGTETIKHSQMEVIDGAISGKTDLLLGVDFLLAHRVYIANSQGKMYFTYNGGRVFTFAKAPSGDLARAVGKSADQDEPELASASDYALRGKAHLSRNQSADAIADLSTAIQEDPDNPAYYMDRAQAYLVESAVDAASADLDSSLRLDPMNVDALLLRAQFRHARHDRKGAAADAATASTLVDPASTQARQLAALDIDLDQPAAAPPLLDKWIDVHGDDAMLGRALNERCRARTLSRQKLDGALSDCRKAIRRDGQKPDYLGSLGLVQLRLGHYPESITAYTQALKLAPKSAWSWYGLGLAELQSGETDAGNSALAASRALDREIDERAAGFGLKAVAK